MLLDKRDKCGWLIKCERHVKPWPFINKLASGRLTRLVFIVDRVCCVRINWVSVASTGVEKFEDRVKGYIKGPNGSLC